MFLRTEHNYDRDKASAETGLACTEEEGLTQQQFKEETDINTIVKRFGLTGELPGDFQMPRSGDFTEVNDFQSAMNMIRTAQQEFDRMPAELRARFNFDPQRLFDFLDDGNNRAEALKLGLIQPPKEKTRDTVTAIDELAAKMAAPQPAANKGTT
ncbi:MAG: internal scaffolding protein [Microvirus sp.]|nr:MAG: internal scaffolding protein [Microvirus sp.]